MGKTIEPRPKLEDHFHILRSPVPLVVWDFNVAVFHIKNWLERSHQVFSPEVALKVVRAGMAAHINRGPSMLRPFPHRAIFVADARYKHTGNYWRNEVMRQSEDVKEAWIQFAEREGVPLAAVPQEYKGTRADKTDDFWFIYNECLDYAKQYYPFFMEEGYEADDFAGCVYRLSRDSSDNSVVKKRQIFLATLDRDWSQCVAEEHRIYMANTRVPFARETIQERLVGNQGVRDHTLHRMGFTIEHPSELAKHKVLHGDMGDNLPVGTPIELFDLCEPHPEYNVDALAIAQDLQKECNTDQPNNNPKHLEQSEALFKRVGIAPPY